MNTEEQRIAIAKACGWKWERLWTGELHGKPVGEQGPFREVPDYLHDLNAMHEAVKTLDKTMKPRYFSCLCMVVYCSISLHGYSAATEATAAQRAEAFLRTIGKWTTNPNTP
jgi:hypothetical protein